MNRNYTIFAALLFAVFVWPLFELARYALGTDLHSHVVLVPVISAWFFWGEREPFLRAAGSPARLAAGGCFLAAAGMLALWRMCPGLSENDALAVAALGFVIAVFGGGFLFLGLRGMWAAAFPFAFLIFTIPLPDAATERIEDLLVMGSTEAADWLFNLTGTPVFRRGTTFELPGIVLNVARECSGIRSSWVLFITSVLAAHMLLKSNWHRVIVLLFIIPLGIVRNGFRILTIGLLCVHVSPDMVHSFIHEKGGPIFFVLSLMPLFALLWFLWRRENSKEAKS